MKPGETLKSIGPAIIVAAVVLGPGSILASSKVGAEWGWLGLPVLGCAVALMIGMVALSARLGVVYQGSLCEELAARLGRGVAVACEMMTAIRRHPLGPTFPEPYRRPHEFSSRLLN